MTNNSREHSNSLNEKDQSFFQSEDLVDYYSSNEESIDGDKLKAVFKNNLNWPLSDTEKKELLGQTNMLVFVDGCGKQHSTYNGVSYSFAECSKYSEIPKNFMIKIDRHNDQILIGIEAFKSDIWNDIRNDISEKPGIFILWNNKHNKFYIKDGENLLSSIIEDLSPLADIYEPKHSIKALEEDVQKYSIHNYYLMTFNNDEFKNEILRKQKMEEIKKQYEKYNQCYNNEK